MARPDPQAAQEIGQRVRRFREERGLTLSALAATSELSKSYVSAIENGETPRPSGQTLYAIAEALGVTMSDLLGRRLLSEVEPARPPSLEDFAAEHHLPEADVRMLASIRFRGGRPKPRSAGRTSIPRSAKRNGWIAAIPRPRAKLRRAPAADISDKWNVAEAQHPGVPPCPLSAGLAHTGLILHAVPKKAHDRLRTTD